MNFKNWLNLQVEIFDKSTFMNHMPENGQWSPSLTARTTFFYSVPSDPKKICGEFQKPCYSVSFNNGHIGFGHLESHGKDRWNDNKQHANPMQIARESMNSILWAIGQYVQTVNPKELTWFPQSKTREDASNPDARGKIYFMWAAKNLYPQYVPVHFAVWERQDYFLQRQQTLIGKELFTQDSIHKMNAKQFLDKLTEFQHYEEKPQLVSPL